MPTDDPDSEVTSDSRYARQMQYAPVGEEGQRQLGRATALVCGCGALGSVSANWLARAGVGTIRLVDRDFLELNNLQRQVVYDEKDVRSGLPKAIAAANRLREVNSTIHIEPCVADVNYRSIEALLDGVDVIVDGTDNFETRFLLNDASVKHSVPWVYGGCIGAEGQVMTIIPGETACLRCLMRDTPPPGITPTCDTAGILGPVVGVIASFQANEVIKILSGNVGDINRTLNIFQLWDNRLRQVNLDSLLASKSCPACHAHEFPWLEGQRGSQHAVLCGRNSVQLSFPDSTPMSLEALEEKLVGIGTVTRNPFLLRLVVDEYQLTVFADGRAVIGGTDDPAAAKTVYSKYVGN
jgi:molybdopterin/thiamine biosynthesis adenylyltransferase